MSTEIKQTTTVTAEQLKAHLKTGTIVSVMKDGKLAICNAQQFKKELVEEITSGTKRFSYEIIYSHMCDTVDVYEKNHVGRNFGPLKMGQSVQTEYGEGSVHVSKGRKMILVEEFESQSEKKWKGRRGGSMMLAEVVYKCKAIMDYGYVCDTHRFAFAAHDSFTMPQGKRTANKWDLYELFKGRSS